MDSEQRKDTHSDGLDELHKPLTVGDDTMKLENTILNSNHEYEQKLELLKKIYEIRRVLDQNIKKLEWVSPQTGVDAGDAYNGYKKMFM